MQMLGRQIGRYNSWQDDGKSGPTLYAHSSTPGWCLTDQRNMIHLNFGLTALFGVLVIAFVLLVVNADNDRSLPSGGLTKVMAPLDPPCGTLDGITIDHMETVGDWHVWMGNGAISATLTTVPGFNGQALRLDYNLGMTPGAYVQLVREFNPFRNLSAGDHLRFFHQGTTVNTLEVGMTSDAGENYFGRPWKDAAHFPWWTHATWDFQDFLKDDIQPFPDFSEVRVIFISVTKKDNGVGGIGSFTVDELQYLNIANRTVPSAFKFVTADPTVTQRAAAWIGDQTAKPSTQVVARRARRASSNCMVIRSSPRTHRIVRN